MKTIILIISTTLLLMLTGCTGVDNFLVPNSPTPSARANVPEDTQAPLPSASVEDITSSIKDAAPKINSDFADAPKKADIESLTKIKVTNVLLQDNLEYELPLEEEFAIVLEEDMAKEYRWLLASDDGLYEFVAENHFNGYRIFVFKPIKKGETYVRFDLTKGGNEVIEVLSYQLFIATPSGD